MDMINTGYFVKGFIVGSVFCVILLVIFCLFGASIHCPNW
jgi:tetrahydromethanopterin S-methyltransferase subunit F